MLTARNLIVAAVAVAATLTVAKFTPSLTAQTQTPAPITSTVFDWNKMESRPIKVGAVRQVARELDAAH